MRKILDKFVAWVLGILQDKRMHFVAGVIIAAFFAISLGMKACIVPVVFAAFIKEFFDLWTGEQFDWKDFAATCIGGLFIQLFVILNVWWF